MDKYFTQRYSVREFSDKEIDESLLNKILEGTIHAPTTGNMQLYSIVITKNPENINALLPAHFYQPAAKNASALVTFCIDLNRFEKWCSLNNAKPYFRNLQSFAAAFFDATIAAQQFCTIAEMEGLGTCYLGTTTYNTDIISQALNLPQLVLPILTVAIGYPKQTNQEATERLPIEAVVHYEKYIDYSDDRIKDLYAVKESLEENKTFVKENNKETLAQVFTDIRYPRENNEIFSKKFEEEIKNKGFGI